MQKLFKTIYFLPVILLCACHNKEVKRPQSVSNIEESQPFFPVTDFLLGQLNEIDSMPVTPLKIIIDNGKRDSIWLKKNDIRPFAKPFLNPLIDSISLHQFFAEESFMDQSINAVTLSYDPIKKLPDSIKLTHWDLYIDPQKGTVQRVYIVKEDTVNGATLTTQLTWKANKWCSIRTIEQQSKIPPRIKEEILKWEFDD